MKPHSYSDEQESRIIFEMDSDISDQTIRLQDNYLRSLIELF